jgi:hypothetical protein
VSGPGASGHFRSWLDWGHNPASHVPHSPNAFNLGQQTENYVEIEGQHGRIYMQQLKDHCPEY